MNDERKMTVLVTGSTQGIGRAIAAEFVRRGHRVIIHCSADRDKAEAVRAELGAASAVAADFSDLSQAAALHRQTGDVDCLILNASVQHKETWDRVGLDTLEAQLTVNFKSSLLLMQNYIPGMKERGFGRVVTVGSVNQYRVHPELPIYSATKCALMSLVKNIAKDVAAYGVTVNNISPGAIATPRNADVFDDPTRRSAVEAAIPMGHFGQPDDCVGGVMLLCSEAGGYITGSDIIIDGGMSLK